MRGRAPTSAVAASAAPATTPTRVPGVIAYTLQGYATTPGRGPPASCLEVGEERGLAGGDRALPGRPPLAAAGRGRLGRGLGARAPGPGPPLLVRDLVA